MIKEEQKTAKCYFCKKRFRLKPWKNTFERGVCFICKVKMKFTIDYILSPREKRIIIFRLGLKEPYITHTLEEAGQEFCVTRERIRQIEVKVLEKVKEIINHEQNGIEN